MKTLLERLLTLFRSENGQDAPEGLRGTPEVSVVELHRMLQEAEPPLLLDVRDPVEKRAADLGGRIVPLWTLPQQLDDLRSWAQRPVVVYCRSGNRSRQAVRFLRENGIEQVYNLKGGLLSWARHFGPPKPMP